MRSLDGWIHRLAPPLLFLALFVLVVLSNQLDWDQALSFFEVDRRAWLIDHVAPRWSYQLCAGATRVGDPLAFGLSPLFVLVLLFGTFWGSKYLVVGCMIAGWLGLRRALTWLFPQLDAQLASALSIFFLFGNYWLWHLHAGQLGFALLPLSMPALALGLKLFRAPFLHSDALWLALLVALVMSAGFYMVVVFWLVPITLCLGAPALALGLARRPDRSSSLRFVGALAVGLLVSSPKWLGVLAHHALAAQPGERPIVERALSLGEWLAAQASPTIRYDYWIGPSEWGPWELWEYTAFSAITVLAIVCLTRRARVALDRRVLGFFFVALLLCVSLTLHEDSVLSLHHLLDRLVYHGAVRVIGRYAIVAQLVMLLFVAWRVAGDDKVRGWVSRWGLPLGYAICALNLAMLFPRVDRAATRATMNVEHRATASMQVQRFVPPHRAGTSHLRPYLVPTSFMYPVLARGEIVPNCYQPLRGPRTIATDSRAFGVEIHDDDTIDLADPDPGPVSEPCRASVAVTQTHVLFDGAICPSDLCLNLNGIDPSADEPFALDEERGKYCRRR